MKEINKQPKKTKIPRWSYAGFLFQTFIQRPFGYVIPLLYVVYLSLILLIVPAIMHFNPLFIWNIGGFNMPVFNLFFIAASAAALAVCIFRTGREDGTELCLSSKPLTKNAMVGMKVFVYLIIMLGFCIITNIITALTLPIFGVYSDANVRGISMQQYIGLNLSMLVGNIVNMLFFGGIAVMITMVGGQVITMIGTVGIVFVMCLMNFIYPQVVTRSIEVLQNKYDAEILSYCCPTLDQYTNNDNSGHKTYATIACVTDEKGEEQKHFDTAKYWKIAEKESGGKATNYIDFARQLSSLFNSFGLDESKLKEASKLSIGMNQGYNYNILEDTHVASPAIANQYPIAFYGMTSRQGMQYPQVLVIGGDMGISTDNWLAISKVSSYDFDSVSILTTGGSLPIASRAIYKEYVTPFKKMAGVRITDAQKTAADALYKDYLLPAIKAATPQELEKEHFFSDTALQIIIDHGKDMYPEGKTEQAYSSLSAQEQHEVVAKTHFAWAVKAYQNQRDSIEAQPSHPTFPFKSSDVNDWYNNNAKQSGQPYYAEFKLGEFIYKEPIQVRKASGTEPAVDGYDQLVISKIDYAETYSNMYQYDVTNFYSIKTIMIVWSLISVMFFTGAIIVYKKTDFK